MDPQEEIDGEVFRPPYNINAAGPDDIIPVTKVDPILLLAA
ncbi:hypothetical protein EGR_09909 [Echinococcus granulosus]|uniref:Uncharacterized protein n=1 Tax=Echinococcus granulosus TaxID=6210 RepID=W6U3T2_ECHGR|nr:hypothetical protein EGR_09909 [Echinococcus granulosus]EUB55246.1 hypothetical protein EGR_09909 [Echinococcus granulosus]